MECTLVASTRNDGPFLLEWVAHHRLLGFTNLVLFSHDCEDGSDALLSALSEAGLLRAYGNSEAAEGLPADPRDRAYRRAFSMNHVRQSDWVMALDTDEFLTVHAGGGRLADLFAAAGECDLLSLTWRLRGTSGQTRYEDLPVTRRFPRCAPADLQVSPRHFGLKTLFRPGPVQRMSPHRPVLRSAYKEGEAPLTWLNGSGEEMTEVYRRRGWASSPATVGYALAQVDHYMIRDPESFLALRAEDPEGARADYASFNSNHVQEPPPESRTAALEAEIARLRAAHPAVAAAHDACVAQLRERIATLVPPLAAADPEGAGRMLSPEAQAEEIRAQEAWVAEASVAEARIEETRIEETRRAAPDPGPGPMPDPKSDPKTGAEEETEDDAPGSDPDTGSDPQEQAPAWLADLRRSDHRRGFYHSDHRFAAHYAERTTETLVVSFDNLSSVGDRALSREGWGYGYYRSEGWSHLGVMSFEKNWYRDETLFDYLEGLAASGFFTRFGQVVLTGTSMGAYAACAFSGLAPGSTVLAFSPQSTLDRGLVPWEERFGSGRRQDWSGRFRDAAESSRAAGRVFLFYDPHFEPDRRHAERFTGGNVQPLATWYAGHKSALFLRRADLLKPITRAAVAGSLDAPSFYRLYRARRELPWYVTGLAEHALERGHAALLDRLTLAMKRQKRWNLARTLEARRRQRAS